MNRTTRIKITELNPHVICVLCGGYFINATTITECLHSFCRTCITRYLETSKYCPVCDVMVHKTRPLDYIRSDKTLQDLVYKLVPGLYKNEMKRRREYYAEVDQPGVTQAPSEDRGDEFHDRIIYTEDEKISLSLELCAEGIPFKTPTNVHGHNGPNNIKIRDVRYLQCPAAFSVGNLKKFIRMKFDLKQKYEVDIFHTAEPLPDYYSLMDIAYIYTWTRRTPLRLFYTVFERKLSPNAIQAILNRQKIDIPHHHGNGNKQHVKGNRLLLVGPDDVSPDLDFEKTKSHKREKKKRGPKPKNKLKKLLDSDVDDSVKEAMSESEEQLAKLTLDCTSDTERPETFKVLNADKNGEKETVNKPDTNNVSESEKVDASNIKSDEVTESESGKENLIVDTYEGTSKVSSTQTSPGSSVNLTLFQPLNVVPDDQKAGSVLELKTDEKQPGKDDTKCPKRGRPKGSKNKVKNVTENGVESPIKTSDKTELQCNGESKLGTSKKNMKKDSKPKQGNDTKSEPKSKKCIGKTENPKEKVKRKYVRKTKLDGESDGARAAKRMKCSETVNTKSDIQTDISDNSQTEVNKTVQSHESDMGVKANGVDSCKPMEICENTSGSSGTTEPVRFPKNCDNEKEEDTKVCERTQEDTDSEQTVGNSLVLEPITPLYGETPKVSESNQGLPCSPNMNGFEAPKTVDNDSADNEDRTCDMNGAINNGTDKLKPSSESHDAIKQNRVISIRPNVPVPTSVTGAFAGFNSNVVGHNGVGHQMPSAHFAYRNSLPVCVSAGPYIGGFTTPLMPVHPRFDHSIRPSYIHCEPNTDQPLDLTNNVHKDEYTKGKIFKTKMLKKMCPKQEPFSPAKDKAGLQGFSNVYPQ